MRHRASAPWATEPATSPSASDSNRTVGARPWRAGVQRRTSSEAPEATAAAAAPSRSDLGAVDDPFALHLTAEERRREASLDEPPAEDLGPADDDHGDHGDHGDDDGHDAAPPDRPEADAAELGADLGPEPDRPDSAPATAASTTLPGAPADASGDDRSSSPATTAAPVTTTAARVIQRKPGRRYSPGDRYNRDVVHSQPKRDAQQVNRPGVRVGGRDLWKVVGGTALRYRITSGRRTEVFDQVTNQMRICLNVGYRNLLIDGAATPCVFVWADGRGSAWLPVRSLEGGDARALRTAVRKQASWTPAQVPSGARFERYRFGDGGRAQPTAHEDGRHAYINHAQKGDANKLEHYLERTTADGRGGQHSYFTVSMNLPQADAPPVAFETAVPGEAFFVPKGASFRRRVGVFEHAAMDPGHHEVWVYGYLGKDGAGGKRVPDAARRGWVPLRVLVRS